MAIVWGEYGPYDDGTGAAVFDTGNGWMTVGNESVASVPVAPSAPAPSAYSDPNAYIVRGNYRMPNQGMGGSRMGGGQLEVMGANGWEPVTAATAPAGYDPRQDSDTQGSNERLRFDQAFSSAPADVPITGMQQWAIANGWQEPSRKNEGTLGAMLSNIAPYAGLMLGGIGAMGGFAGGLGAASGGLDTASLAAGDAMAGAIPAGELGAWTGAGAAGTTAGSGAMDWSNLGDLWDYAGGGTEYAPQNVVDLFNNAGMEGFNNYGQSLEELAAELFNNAGTPGFDQYGNEASGLDWIKSQFGGPGSTTSTATNALKTLFGGGEGSSGGTDWMKLLGGLGAAGLGAYASNKQTSALENMAKRYEGYGAPYRQKLSDLYANPDSFLQSNEVQKPVQQGTDMLMRSLSMQGNPFGSGNALQQGQSYASDQLFGKLGQEKDRLAGFGGLAAYNGAAPQAATNAIQSSGNTYNAIGSGLGNIFNPPQTAAQTMADFMKAMKG